ncbi:LysM domain-containing protein [Marinobacter halodurans]|uniref:LysM domain-containing protein n=1 Tax=Marinobacter halodurans TaxID=2528979 RepID=A0ABY1ZFE0_9GAMM|nr:LysM domain-containing protein [Marinobacter halodurans]TBW45987.1 LysM domain-containing protein [Marinobacter halodurans]
MMASAYTVQAGDTLSRIAQKNNATVSGLMRLNPSIEDPNRIYTGQQLKLPGSHGQPLTASPATDVSESAPCADEYVEIVHVTGTEELLFLTEYDLNELIEEEKRVGGAIEKLYKDLQKDDAPTAGANGLPTDREGALTTAIQQEKDAAVKELQDLGIVSTTMQSTPKLTEIKRLKGNKHYTYVRSDKIANHWRSYKMTAKDRNRSAGWLTQKGIDTGKLREAVEADFGIKFNSSFWKLDPDSHFSKSLNQFYEEVSWSIWGSSENRQKNRDATGFDASAEAQFMRFAAGASASGEFKPIDGKVHLQAKASAQFSLAQGKASIEQAYPANDESEIRIYYHEGGWDGPLAYQSMGHFQAKLTISVSGYAGASALLAANVKVDCSEGVPSIKGIAGAPADDEGAYAEAGAFAGVRAGCEVLGGLYWIDKLTRQSDWKTICQIGEKVEGAAGIGAEAYLKLGFSDKSGKFFLRAHAGLVFGLGASGTFVFEVNVNDIASMMRFIYNSLLKTDLRYLEIFDNETNAFTQYVRISLLALSKGLDYASAAAEFTTSTVASVEIFVRNFIQAQQYGRAQEKEGEALAKNIQNDIARGENSVFLHSPPEVKGPILHKLT